MSGFEGEVLKVRHDLEAYREASDAISALDLLRRGERVVYIERGEKLDSRIETIFVDYAAGIASFASPQGLVASQFNPLKASLTVVVTRDALEQSYPHLLAYAGAITSV